MVGPRKIEWECTQNVHHRAPCMHTQIQILGQFSITSLLTGTQWKPTWTQ